MHHRVNGWPCRIWVSSSHRKSTKRLLCYPLGNQKPISLYVVHRRRQVSIRWCVWHMWMTTTSALWRQYHREDADTWPDRYASRMADYNELSRAAGVEVIEDDEELYIIENLDPDERVGPGLVLVWRLKWMTVPLIFRRRRLDIYH